MHCVACKMIFSLGDAGTGDEVTCPHCGVVQEVGELIARVPARRRLRTLRMSGGRRVGAPLRAAGQCALLAAGLIAGCLLVSRWPEVRAEVVARVHDLCHRFER